MDQRAWFFLTREKSGWEVHSDDCKTEQKSFTDKREAISYAREIARKHEPSLLVVQ